MHADIQQILLSESQIHDRIAQLGRDLMRDYGDKNPIFVGVLKGVVMFFGDFVKRFSEHCQIDFMWISSYGSGTQSGKMVVKRDVSADLKGRHVVILEDIFDTGNSLDFTYKHLLAKEPASLKICTLLDKPERRAVKGVDVDYVGFNIPDEFVVGYGLDYDQRYRNLPYIGIVKFD